MSLHKTRVTFDSDAQVSVKGKVRGREVEYTGTISEMTVRLDDGIDPDAISWKAATWCQEETTYSFEFVPVDGKAITAKIGPKYIDRTARVHYPYAIDNRHEVRRIREELGAPDGAKYVIDFAAKTIEFSWTDEVQ
jgi:hypothetical protein